MRQRLLRLASLGASPASGGGSQAFELIDPPPFTREVAQVRVSVDETEGAFACS